MHKLNLCKAYLFNNQKFNISFLLHEYQAQNLLRNYEINTPIGEVVLKEADIDKVIKRFDKGNVFAVKAQSHTGERCL